MDVFWADRQQPLAAITHSTHPCIQNFHIPNMSSQAQTTIKQCISPQRVVSNPAITSKKKALELAAQLIADSDPELRQNDVFASLLEREAISSTGLGNGIAIPHGRVNDAKQAWAAIIKLEQGIDYDAIDKQPVDLIMALVIPAEEHEQHLQLLANIAEMCSDPELCIALRAADTDQQLYQALSAWPPQAKTA